MRTFLRRLALAFLVAAALLYPAYLEARPEGVSLGFLDYRATGFGGVTWSVERTGVRTGDRKGRVRVVFDRFSLQRHGYPRPHVRGRGLRVDAVSAAPRFDAMFVPERLTIDMPGSEVPDLAFYNAYLPRKSPVAVTAGSGSISGRFAAVAPGWRGAGEVRLSAHGMQALVDQKRLRGTLDIHTRLRMSLEDRRYDISGSDVALTDVTLLDGAAGSAPWWIRAHLDQAVLTPGAPVSLHTKIESTLSDSRPLFALFAPAEHSRMLRWVDHLVDIHGIGATAELTMGRGFLDVSHLAIAGGKAELLARLRFAGPNRRGILYASYGPLNVGMELEGTKKDWKLLHAKQWYESYPAFH